MLSEFSLLPLYVAGSPLLFVANQALLLHHIVWQNKSESIKPGVPVHFFVRVTEMADDGWNLTYDSFILKVDALYGIHLTDDTNEMSTSAQ